MLNTEEILLVPEIFLQGVLDSLSTHIAILDFEGNIVYTNRAWQIFSQQSDSYLRKLSRGTNYFQVCNCLPEKDFLETQIFVQGIRDVISSRKTVFEIEIPYFSLSNQHYFLSKVTRFYVEQKLFLVIAYENITEHKIAQQELIESQIQLNSLLENNILGIANWNLDGRITKTNNAFLRMVGYNQEDLLMGRLRWKDLTPPEYVELNQFAIKELKEYGHFTAFEKEYICKNGSRVPVLVVGAFFSNSKESGFSCILDLTEIKALQAQLIQAQKMENIGTLASGIAHDLNNILTPILMFVQLLRRKATDSKDHKVINIIEDTVKRGSNLVRQILSLTRKTTQEKEKIDFQKLFSEIDLLTKETFPKSIKVSMNIKDNLGVAVGNNTEIHQVILNLCINARDAMPNGGELIVEVKNVYVDESYQQKNCDANIGEHILVSISDTGTGISSDNLDKIFAPLFTTKGSEKGTGLGLPIVMRILKKHGGFISVNSEVEIGSEFNVYLPIYKQTTAERLLALEEDIMVGQGETILVVDDEETLRELTKQILEIYQYKVLTANDGTDAIATYAINRDKISLVLTDLMMPNMDGSTTIKTLRKINPNIKLMAVTGLIDGDLADEVKKQNIPVLAKPFTAQKLLKNIHNLLH